MFTAPELSLGVDPDQAPDQDQEPQSRQAGDKMARENLCISSEASLRNALPLTADVIPRLQAVSE